MSEDRSKWNMPGDVSALSGSPGVGKRRAAFMIVGVIPHATWVELLVAPRGPFGALHVVEAWELDLERWSNGRVAR